MRNKKLVLLIGLSITAVLALIYGMTASRPSNPRGAAAGLNQQVSAEENWKDLIPVERNAPRSQFLVWGRNPFRRESMPVSSRISLDLQGIAWDPKVPKAVISDRIVGLGDEIGGMKVADIRHDSVVVSDGSTETELKLDRNK